MAPRTFDPRQNASDREIPTSTQTLNPDAASALACGALDARLDRGSTIPIVVAFSGGGDSLALLLAAKRWADKAGRRLLALTVDHALQPTGVEWAVWCADRAARMAVDHQVLTWCGLKPATGVPAAARVARHRLIANAAREAGAQVILMGHTADDCLEAGIMRDHGLRVSAPRLWSPSPVWPEGRGLFILRPLLATRRSAIRAALRFAGETWIDDPLNLDLRQPRARARALVAACSPTPPDKDGPALADLEGASEVGVAGDIELPLQSLLDAAPNARRAFLATALLCASGGETPPRGPQVERLLERIEGPGAFASTLAGARVSKADDMLKFAREIGDGRNARRTIEHPLPSESAVWDGRFEVQTSCPGLTVMPLAGLAARLSAMEGRRLRDIDPAARRGIPVIVDHQGGVTCPLFQQDIRITLQSLVAERLAGACGAIQREAAIWRVAKSAMTS